MAYVSPQQASLLFIRAATTRLVALIVRHYAGGVPFARNIALTFGWLTNQNPATMILRRK
jgi:hypothetical protein